MAKLTRTDKLIDELLEDNWVKQEIIFSSGAELIIEFKDFTYSQKEPHNNQNS